MAIPIEQCRGQLQQFQQPLLQEPDYSGIGYGFSIAGHVVIALLLLYGVFERIELVSVAAIPVEVVVERPVEAARQVAPASSPAVSTLTEQKRPSATTDFADVEKRAKAPLAAVNVNGVDRPKQPGKDGADPSSNPSSNPAGSNVPKGEGELAPGNAPSASQAIVGPLGPAPPQTTAREPGDDELTALAEQKVECGIMAKRQLRTAPVRDRGRVIVVATEALRLASIRNTQATADRRINPNYLRSQTVFAELLEGRGAVMLPSGFTVNAGDEIEFDRGYIDPSNACQYIPALAVRKL